MLPAGSPLSYAIPVPLYHIFRENQCVTALQQGKTALPEAEFSKIRLKPGSINNSISGTGFRRKIFLEFVRDPLPVLAVGRGFLLGRDVRPDLREFSVHAHPLLGAGLRIGL